MLQDTKKAARLFYDSGLMPIPAMPGTKRPESLWGQFQHTLKDWPEIEVMFNKPVERMGIICGGCSGGAEGQYLEVLDFDDPAAYESYREAMQDYLPGLDLPVVRSPSGGYHMYYRTRVKNGNAKLAMGFLSAEPDEAEIEYHGTFHKCKDTAHGYGAYVTVIETRGQGGWVVSPPSEGYQTVNGTLTNVPVITDEQYETLRSVARAFSMIADEPAAAPIAVKTETGGVPIASGEETPGAQYNREATLEDMMRVLEKAGWRKDPNCRASTYTAWIRPGKRTGPGASLGINGHTVFNVFTSNAHPLEQGKAYSPFALRAFLEFDGDFKACARHLATEQGRAPKTNGVVRPALSPLWEPTEPAGYDTEEPAADEAEYMDWIPYPLETLPRTMRSLVVESARALGVDPSAVALSAMTTAAAAIGNSYRMNVKGAWTVPSILWCLLVSRNGTKKNATMKAAMYPIDKLEEDSFKAWRFRQDMYERSRLEWEDAKMHVGPKKAGPAPEAPAPRNRYRVKDITTETFGLMLSRNERGLMLYREEMDGWLSSFNQYKGGKGSDEMVWTEMFDGDSVQIDRMSRDVPEIYIRRAHACLIGCIQPRIYKQAVTGARIASGFIHRFLVIMPPEPAGKRWRKEEVDPEVLRMWSCVIEDMYANKYDPDTGCNIISMTPEAEALMEAWVDETGELMRALPDHLRGMTAKVEAVAAKIAMVIAIYEWHEKGGTFDGVDADAMARGIHIARWHRYEMARLYQQIELQDEEGAIKEDKAYDALPTEFAREDVMRAYGIKHPTSASRKIKGLVEQGKVESVSRGVYRRKTSANSALAAFATGLGSP
jgi:hypothetical protein